MRELRDLERWPLCRCALLGCSRPPDLRGDALTRVADGSMLMLACLLGRLGREDGLPPPHRLPHLSWRIAACPDRYPPDFGSGGWCESLSRSSRTLAISSGWRCSSSFWRWRNAPSSAATSPPRRRISAAL